jgi:hypothetical protein
VVVVAEEEEEEATIIIDAVAVVVVVVREIVMEAAMPSFPVLKLVQSNVVAVVQRLLVAEVEDEVGVEVGVVVDEDGVVQQ